MGRWIDMIREHQPRDWMLPEATPAPGGEPAAERDGVQVTVRERGYRTPWARGPRAPLRRNQGVPAPLETPLYLHQAELARLRSRRREPWAVVAWGVAAAAVTATVIRLILES